MMNLKEAMEYANPKLSLISDSSKLDAQLLLCHVCNIGQTTIIAHPEHVLSEYQQQQFESELMRRMNGVASPRILDLGTGSGAIAISIAKERDDCIITASDISPQALEIASRNAAQHKVIISFIQSNWYNDLASETFDAIICNPPYIAKNDFNIEENVSKHEPSHALISEENGLYDLEIVITNASRHLYSEGWLLVEHGFQQAVQVQRLFNQHGFHSIQTHKDLARLDRVTTGQSLKMA
ncbi:MAG: peptide chain release factor N(5)-glutamine methyltransferase [Gammaproteobacteria bacterium]